MNPGDEQLNLFWSKAGAIDVGKLRYLEEESSHAI